MRNAKTVFEQVPIALARKALAMELGSTHNTQVSCAICETAVQLESCKIDEKGRAVHDGCYLSRVVKPARSMARRTPGN